MCLGTHQNTFLPNFTIHLCDTYTYWDILRCEQWRFKLRCIRNSVSNMTRNLWLRVLGLVSSLLNDITETPVLPFFCSQSLSMLLIWPRRPAFSVIPTYSHESKQHMQMICPEAEEGSLYLMSYFKNKQNFKSSLADSSSSPISQK